jgi:tetratricopeptide (TPR) repeat protein
MVSRAYPLNYFPIWGVVSLLFILVGITPALSGADTPLELNKPIERELKGGETHYYELPVKAGDYVALIVDQRGIDVLVRLQAPDGAIVAEVDSPNGSQGPEPITVIIEVAGLYRLSVSALEQAAKPGRYEAKLVERHLATQADRQRIVAEKLSAEALALYNEGSRQALERSLNKYEEALEHFATAGARKEQITALTNSSGVARRIGALDKALEYAKRALQTAELLGDKRSQAEALRLISAVHRSSGEYEQELRSSERSLLLYQEAGDRDSEAYMLQGIAAAFSYLGEQEKARSYYERSLKIYQALGNKHGEAMTFRSIGYSYVLDDRIREGIDSFNKALAIWHFYESTKQEAIEHSFIANEYARLGERQQALENADKALRLRGVNGDFNEGTILTNVGHAFNKLKEFEKALNCYKDALKIWQDLRDKRGEAITLKHTAAVFRDQGRLAEALTTIERSIALVEFSRDRAGSPELRA